MRTLCVALLTYLFMCSSYACGGGCQSGCTESPLNTCQCSDPNYNSNPCLTVDQYCEAYGNISGLDEYP